MSETSGFFQAQWDSSLKNPITEEYTGWWDRDYLAQMFSDYFALFIGNGVFGSPTNQCKVIPGTGLSVIVTPGWAFINGSWYHNDAELTLTVPANAGSSSRSDSIMLRLSKSSREIKAIYLANESTPTRGSNIYDLKIAGITVNPGAIEIAGANITDTRTNESVCGLVKGLMEVETTADLFAQYEAIFDEWFDTVKGQVTGDLAIRLQLEFTQLNENVETYQEAVTQQISDYNDNYQEVLDGCEQIIEDYVGRDFVIAEQTFVFDNNNQCRINNSNVTDTTLIDVYFTQATINEAVRCGVYVESFNGYILLTAQRTPASSLVGTIGVRVR